MRLIDADLFVKEVAKHFTQPNYHPDADAFMAMEAEQHNEYIHGFIEDIEAQPTAYDVDKVIEKLVDKIDPNVDSETGEPCWNWVVDMQNELIGECIDIVRSGGVKC